MKLPYALRYLNPRTMWRHSSRQVRTVHVVLWAGTAVMIVSAATGFRIPLWLILAVMLPAMFYGTWRLHVETKTDMELARAVVELSDANRSLDDLPPHLREHLNILHAKMKLNPPQ